MSAASASLPDTRAVRDWARFYIGMGLQVVPLAPNSKACTADDWPRLVFKPDDFQDGDNIGIRWVTGVVDVDLDSPETVELADDFLPETGAVYGRASAPRSHRLYAARFEKSHTLKDENGGMLVEIRASHQTMAPPSTHPCGEPVTWESSVIRAADADPEELENAVRLLATTALVGRHYPPPRARHDWGLALSGAMRHLSIDEADAGRVVTAAARWARDGEVRDRLAALRGTYSKDDDDHLISLRTLAKLTAGDGRKFVSALRAIWGGTEGRGLNGDVIGDLNKRHAVVFQQSGQLIVITEEEEDGLPQLRFSRPESMRQLYPQLVQVGTTGNHAPIMKPLGQEWVNSPKRRFYRGIELAPPGSTPNDGFYNLWRGFSVEPQAGDWSLFHRHIEDVMANGDPDHAAYILAWMAKCVQEAGRPARTSLAFRGGQGVGKSSFATWFGRLFGPHFLHLDSPGQLVGRFNGQLHNAILVFADEAAWPRDKAGVGALRRMVTEETLNIERKGIDTITVKNRVHLLVASNEDWVVPAALDERRFAVFDVSSKRRNDHAHFGAIKAQLDGGGLAAMLYDLLKWESDVDLRVIPKTKALDEQKQHSMDPMRNWWLEKLRSGRLVGGDWPREVLYASLHADYLEFVRAHFPNEHSPRSTETQLGIFLHRMAPGRAQKRMLDGQRQNLRIMSTLKECRDVWAKDVNLSQDFRWDEEDEA